MINLALFAPPALVFTAYSIAILRWGRVKHGLLLLALFGLTFPVWVVLGWYGGAYTLGYIRLLTPGPPGRLQSDNALMFSTITFCGVTTALVFLAITRSKLLLLLVSGVSVATGLLVWPLENSGMPAWIVLHAVWHGGVAASLYWWARSRRRDAIVRQRLYPYSRHCLHCDYDLAGLPTRRCPECGQPIWTKPQRWWRRRWRWSPPQVNRR